MWGFWLAGLSREQLHPSCHSCFPHACLYTLSFTKPWLCVCSREHLRMRALCQARECQVSCSVTVLLLWGVLSHWTQGYTGRWQAPVILLRDLTLTLPYLTGLEPLNVHLVTQVLDLNSGLYTCLTSSHPPLHLEILKHTCDRSFASSRMSSVVMPQQQLSQPYSTNTV